MLMTLVAADMCAVVVVLLVESFRKLLRQWKVKVITDWLAGTSLPTMPPEINRFIARLALSTALPFISVGPHNFREEYFRRREAYKRMFVWATRKLCWHRRTESVDPSTQNLLLLCYGTRTPISLLLPASSLCLDTNMRYIFISKVMRRHIRARPAPTKTRNIIQYTWHK